MWGDGMGDPVKAFEAALQKYATLKSASVDTEWKRTQKGTFERVYMGRRLVVESIGATAGHQDNWAFSINEKWRDSANTAAQARRHAEAEVEADAEEALAAAERKLAGKRLKSLREERGLSYEDLAQKRLRGLTSPLEIQQFEKGGLKVFNKVLLPVLARFFSVPTDYFKSASTASADTEWKRTKGSALRSKLYADATAAGYTVTRESGGHVDIVRRAKPTRNYPRGMILAGIRIYEDGTAVRLDVDLSVAAGMRSYAVMRKVLGLGRT